MLNISLGNAEQLILTLVQQLGDIKRVLINHILDESGCPYKLTLDILLQHNAGMILYVGGRDDPRCQLGEIDCATGLFKIIDPLQLLGDGQQVYRLVALVELQNGGKDLLMRCRIEDLRP